MQQNQELNQLVDECNSFIDKITLYASTDSFSPFKIISLDNFGSDSYSYDSEFDIANILVCRDLLRKRYERIDCFLHLIPQYTKEQVLKEMYSHILDHEMFHFRSKNIKAFELKTSGKYLSEQEIKIIRDEEYNAENYAIKMAEERGDSYLSIIAILIEIIIRVNEIKKQGHEEKEDIIHMSDKEIINKMSKQNTANEQKRVIALFALQIGLTIV